MSIKFPPAILGPEMAAPILWAPGIFAFFLLENPHAHKIPLFRGGGGSWVFLEGGGGSVNFIFMGVGIFPISKGAFQLRFNTHTRIGGPISQSQVVLDTLAQGLRASFLLDVNESWVKTKLEPKWRK